MPAYVAMRATDLHADPQLAHHEFFVELEHPRIGRALFDGAVTRFGATPAVLRNAGPTIGQDSFHVLSELLGFDDEEIAALAETGALT